MTRNIAIALAMLATCAAPALAADGDSRISGRLTDIRADGKLVIEEQGPWKGPGTGLVSRTVELTPATSIRVLRPTGTWGAGDAQPGYEVQEADFRALKPGEFVTVTTGGRSVAASIDVMRTDGGDTEMASPRLDGGTR
jgi:hypothetical protein